MSYNTTYYDWECPGCGEVTECPAEIVDKEAVYVELGDSCMVCNYKITPQDQTRADMDATEVYWEDKMTSEWGFPVDIVRGPDPEEW